MKILSKIYKLLFYIFIGYPLYALSFLFPRKKGRWVFTGKNFSDNSKYLFIEISQKYPEIDAIWVSDSQKTVDKIKSLGAKSYYQNSIKGYYYLLTCNIHIISHYMGTPYWTLGRSKLINLWHGVGIKNILFGSQSPITNRIYHHFVFKWLYRPFLTLEYRKLDLLVATSPAMQHHFSKCFKTKENSIIESSYPRCNIFNLNKKKLLSYINKYENSTTLSLIEYCSNYKKVYIYMPTWRIKNPDYLNLAKINFSILDNLMQDLNALFLIKLHPLTIFKNQHEISAYKNIIIINNNIDIYPILPFTDCLITDYSSIYYDYMLLKNKSAIFFLFDYEDYINNSQDLIMDFDQATEGAKAYNFNELIEILKIDLPLPINKSKKEQIMKLFWGEESEKKDIIEEIKKLER